jgi:hypothetical protein
VGFTGRLLTRVDGGTRRDLEAAVEVGELPRRLLLSPVGGRARAEQQGQGEILAPPPVRLLIDGDQGSAELVRAQEAIAFLFVEGSDSSGGLVAEDEAPGAGEVRHRAEQGQRPVGGVVTAVASDSRVQLRDFLARQVGEPAIPLGGRYQRRLLSRATQHIPQHRSSWPADRLRGRAWRSK